MTRPLAVQVDCDLRKWDGRQGYTFTAGLLGRDEHGTWLGVGAGTEFIGPKSPGVWQHPFVTCVPEGSWWLATFYDEGSPLDMEVYVDITTVSQWPTASSVTCVDLDLDVVRYHDGRIELLDEDEFEEHRVEMSYPEEIVRRALETTSSVRDAVEARREPFDTVGRRWLAHLVAAS